MIESEFALSDLLPDFDDPESPDRPDRITRTVACDYDDDDDDDEPLTPRQKKFGIYEEFYTPQEKRAAEAIPENDYINEINLLKSMLLETFAMMPTGPEDKKHPLTPKFQYDLFTVCCRSVIVLARLVALHKKLNSSRNKTADLIWEALGEMDPHDLGVGDDDSEFMIDT